MPAMRARRVAILTSPGERAYTRATTTPMVATKVTSVSNQIIATPFPSDLEVNDFPQYRRTDDLQNSCDDKHHRALRVAKKNSYVMRIDDTENAQHDNR